MAAYASQGCGGSWANPQAGGSGYSVGGWASAGQMQQAYAAMAAAGGSHSSGWMNGAGKGGSNSGGMPQGKGVPQPAVMKQLNIECKHASMVSKIANGTFSITGENHDKPTYKKDVQVSGLDILIYYWDERDGADQCGWYLGPEIGGNQVWAYNPERSTVPPKSGWQVPYGGPVDQTFVVSPAGGAGSPAAPTSISSNGTPASLDAQQQRVAHQGSQQPPQQQQQQLQQPQQQLEQLLQQQEQQQQSPPQQQQEQQQQPPPPPPKQQGPPPPAKQQGPPPQQQQQQQQQQGAFSLQQQWQKQAQRWAQNNKQQQQEMQQRQQQGHQWSDMASQNSERLRELEWKEQEQKKQEDIEKRKEEWTKRQAELRVKVELEKQKKAEADERKREEFFRQQEELKQKKTAEDERKREEFWRNQEELKQKKAAEDERKQEELRQKQEELKQKKAAEDERKQEEIRQKQEEIKRKQEELKQKMEEKKKQQEEFRQKAEEEKKRRDEEQKKQQEELRQKKEEEKKKKQEEMAKKQEERKAQMEVQRKKQMEDWNRKKEALAKKQQEDKQRLDEEMSKHKELMRIKAEEEEKKQQELKKKREEELKKQQEEEAVRQAERKAATAIRKVIQKVRAPLPENYEEAKQELEEVVKEELEKTGGMKQTIKEECEKAIEQGQKRVEQVIEDRKKAAAKKVEEERRQKEALEIAIKLVEEFDGMVQKIEGKVAEVEEVIKQVKSFSTEKSKGEELQGLCTKVKASSEEVTQLLQLISDFSAEQSSKIQDPILAKAGSEATELKKKYSKLKQRLAASRKMFETKSAEGDSALEEARKRKRAQDKTDELKRKFQKYDKKSKGILSKQEVLTYAKTEFNFDFPQADLAAFWVTLDAEGDAGVKFEKFKLLQMAIGIARERERDLRKAEERAEQERVLVKVKENLVQQVKETSKMMLAALEQVKIAESQVKKLTRKTNLARPMSEMVQLADETDLVIENAQQPVENALRHLDQMVESVDERFQTAVQGLLSKEARNLLVRLSLMDRRIQRTRQISKHFRQTAGARQAEEFEALYGKTLKLLRYNQKLKKLDSDGLFKVFDTKGDNVIDEAEWLAFFASADTEVKELELELEATVAHGEPDSSATDAGKEPESKSSSADDAKDDSAPKEEKAANETPKETPMSTDSTKAETVVETVTLTQSELSCMFAYIDEEGKGKISKDVFLQYVQTVMRVVRKSIMGTDVSLKGSKNVRVVEANEVLEVISGPVPEPEIKVPRVQAKALKDGSEGWLSIFGNQGTVFLAEGQQLYKVVRGVDLTDAFELDSEVKPKLNLKVGMLLEVRVPPKKEAETGLMRMKGKVRGEGSVGWVTTTGFLKPM